MMKEASMTLHDVDQAATAEVAPDDETFSKASIQESAATEGDSEGEEDGLYNPDEEYELYKHRDDELCRLYRPLRKAALMGDWESAERFLISQEGKMDITQGVNRLEMSILHVAANMGHAEFMWKLLRSRFFPKEEAKRKEALAKKDKRHLTPLNYAASVGNLTAIKLLVSLDNSLTQIGGQFDDEIPLILAAVGKASRRVLWYLAKKTEDYPGLFTGPDGGLFTGPDGARLIYSLVMDGHYDICLYLFNRYPYLPSDAVRFWEHNLNYDLLGCLVCRQSDFPRREKMSFWGFCIYQLIHMETSFNPQPRQTKMAKVTQWILRVASESLSYIVPGFKDFRDKKYQQKCIIQLLHIACQKMSEWDVNEILSYFKKTEVHYDAVEHGGTEIIRAFIEYFPDIMDEAYVEGQILIRAVQHRQVKTYNIMMEKGITLKFLPDIVDLKTEDNILHIAARLAPYVHLSSVASPALQMQRELQWFKGVENFVPHKMKIAKNKMENNVGLIPRELFTITHKDLVRDAERWMKETANSCLVVATLIITVVFAAAFTIPGGNIDGTDIPLLLRRNDFVIFVVSDAVGMFSSATSILFFLSILTARYAEEDFLRTIPTRFIFGLTSLLIAIACMMVTFGVAVYMILNPRFKWVIYPIVGLTCIPVGMFLMLQLPLFFYMVKSTYGSILKPMKGSE